MTIDFGTIAAVATAPGEAGIAVIRISGPEVREIVARVVRLGRSGPPLMLDPGNSHQLFYGRVIDPTTEHVVDEVMVAWMAAPRSFTTEDTVEISCHGGVVASQQVLRAVLAAGARPANPGEFTMRAFLNGRIALTEAEAVLNVVSAQTSEGLGRALDDLRGDLTRRLEPARAAVLAALAYLDASADFPDDEIPVSDVHADLSHAVDALEGVLAGAKSGRLLSEGATVALVGRPNVGKSSLLNALLRSDRAIVTPIAGTTRDVVSERAVIEGIPVTLLDTAGIAESADVIELAGIERSRQAIARSATIVLVVDGSVAPTIRGPGDFAGPDGAIRDRRTGRRSARAGDQQGGFGGRLRPVGGGRGVAGRRSGGPRLGQDRRGDDRPGSGDCECVARRPAQRGPAIVAQRPPARRTGPRPIASAGGLRGA